MDALQGEDDGASAKVQGGASQHRRHAAEGIEEGLRDTRPKEGHADGQPTDQDAGGAQRCAKFHGPRLEPRRRRHCKNVIKQLSGKINTNALLPLLDDVVIGLIPSSVRRLASAARVGHFATSNGGDPGLVPVCFVFEGDTVYHAIDAKPKSVPGGQLARVRNLTANPSAALLLDHYEEDWHRLWYVLFRGRARVITGGEEHRRAIEALRRKYVQYRRAFRLDEDAIVIALDVRRLWHWRSNSPGRHRRAPADRR